MPVMESSQLSYHVGMVPSQALLPLLLVSLGVLLVVRRIASYRHIPGPWLCRVSHHYVAFFELLRGRPQIIARWHAKYGPFVLIAPGQVSIADPSAMRDLYSTSKRNPKSKYFDHFIYHNARSIFAELPYEEHRRKRSLSSAFYQATSILKPEIQNPLRERAMSVVSGIRHQLKSAKAVDVFPVINHFAWDNITALVYGPRHRSHSVEMDGAEREMLAGLKDCELWKPIDFNLPFAHYLIKKLGALYLKSPKFLMAEEELDKWSMQRLAEAVSDPLLSSDTSVVRLLKEDKRRLGGQKLTEDYVACEVIDNLLAAQATVTVALTFVVYHLSRNPDWQAEVQKELDGLPRLSDGLPAYSVLDKCSVLEACIRESYRVNPVSSGRAERCIAKGEMYGGVFLPENTVASASTIALHLDPEVFPEPGTFNPRRWLEASPEQLLVLERSFIPFGYGARICLGKTFANLQVKSLVAAILQSFNTSLDNPAEVMEQWGTQDALPKGLACKIRFQQRQSPWKAREASTVPINRMWSIMRQTEIVDNTHCLTGIQGPTRAA